jgi:hypothetical protein
VVALKGSLPIVDVGERNTKDPEGGAGYLTSAQKGRGRIECILWNVV